MSDDAKKNGIPFSEEITRTDVPAFGSKGPVMDPDMQPLEAGGTPDISFDEDDSFVMDGERKKPELAHRGVRWMALVIDLLPIQIFTLILGQALGEPWLQNHFMNMFLYICISAFFHVEFHATPGKMAMGLVCMDKRNKPLTWKASWIRSAVAALSLTLFSIGHFVYFFNKKKLAAHDFAAQKTRVVVLEERSRIYIAAMGGVIFVLIISFIMLLKALAPQVPT